MGQKRVSDETEGKEPEATEGGVPDVGIAAESDGGDTVILSTKFGQRFKGTGNLPLIVPAGTEVSVDDAEAIMAQAQTSNVIITRKEKEA